MIFIVLATATDLFRFFGSPPPFRHATSSQVCSFLFFSDDMNTQVDGKKSKTLAFLEDVARRLLFLCWRRTRTFRASFTQGVPSCRAGPRTLSFSFGLTSSLQVVFHSTLFTSRALTFQILLYAIYSSQLSFVLRLAFDCTSARGRLFKLSFLRRETFLTSGPFEVPDHRLLHSDLVLRITLLNSILNMYRGSNDFSCSDS